MSYQPDFVFHLATQSLVKKSYLNPAKLFNQILLERKYTGGFETN